MTAAKIHSKAPWWAFSGRGAALAVGFGLAMLAGSAVVLSGDERDRICRPGFAAAGRPAPAEWERLRRAVYARERIPYDHHSGEVDHIVPRCLDGPNTLDNLQFQPWPEAHAKDRREVAVCRAFCGGKLSLAEARGYFR